MRIGIDAKFLGYRHGHGNYSFSLLSHLGRANTPHRFFVYSTSDVHEGTLAELRATSLDVQRLGPANYIVRDQLGLPVRALRDHLDLLHCPDHSCPFNLPARTTLLVTLHDVMFMMPRSELPASSSIYHRAGALYRRITARHAARRAAAIITVSRKSADDIQRYLGVATDRIHVIHEAPASRFRRLEPEGALAFVRAAGIAGKYILALGGVDPRKNTRRVIEAFAAAKEAAAAGLTLVIAGLPVRSIPGFASHAERLGVRDEVVFLDFVPEETLVALYNAAEMFLYPSLYEGFGLPVLEAMACGTPVIASTTGSIPEVAGDAAILVNPSDTRAIADAIVRVAGESDLRHELIRRGEARAREFSWERAARETIRVYEECLRD